MNPTKTAFFLMVLMCVGTSLFSQKHLGNYDQLLATGTQTPMENLEAFLEKPDIERDEIIGNRFYRLVQFFEIPTIAERRTMEIADIYLFDYLPHKTYLASLPQDFSPTEMRNFNIRSITKIQMQQKISPKIADEEKIALQYFPDLSPAFVQSFLENKNIEIHSFLEKINAVVICNNPTQLTTIAAFPITFFISPAQGETLPEFVPGKNVHRSNYLSPKIAGYPQYNGEGVNVAIGDDGMLEPHIDFKNRIFQSEVLGDLEGTHGEMVAGILAGAGNLNPRMEGTASHADVHLYDKFETVTRADALYHNQNILITSTSYSDGCNRGYTHLAQLADQQTRTNSSLLHIFSAGNTGNEDCGYGAAAGWGNITGGVKMGKNVLTVGNVNSDDELSPTSSRGPANDGRIKPDLTANGDGQFSTQPNHTYAEANGSSAAAPGVAGVFAQLYQAYAVTHNNTFPNSGLVKAAVLNTAEDLGNPGPDFSYGYGRINARRALEVLENEQYFEATMGHSSSHSYFINVPTGVQQLRVLLHWNDYQGSTMSSPALVNDLDLKVQNTSDETYLPWVLNSTADANLLNLPAVRGVDNLNNVEQVTIDAPKNGVYSFSVEGAVIAQGEQPYFVTYEFVKNNITLTYPIGGEKLIPGTVEKIHWDAFGNHENFQIKVSYNNGITWEVLGLVSGAKRNFLWEIPNVATKQVRIRVQRENEIGNSLAPFSIYKIPQNFHVAEVCPDAVRLEWNAMDDANSYLIYKLGEKYMSFFATTPNSFIEIPIDNPTEENWYAVAAVGKNNLISQRSNAITDGTNLWNCELETDISIHSIAQPANAILQSCFGNALTVSVNLKNTGTEFQANVPVFYQLDNQAVVSEIYNSSIPPNVAVNYTFSQKIPVTTQGIHQLKVWTAQPNDQATFNDTSVFDLKVVPSISETLPYFQNFDNFENCNVNAACDAPCPLNFGWYNDDNQLSDDSDWLVHFGETTTPATGPSFDQNTDTGNGKYLYLEGSRSCTEMESYLLSPCFDLTAAAKPVLNFWVHMRGANMGSLHVDLFDGENWFYNITPTLSGEQGNDWQSIEIDLTAFVNKTVNFRFRGVTGNDFLTDMAIDNVALFDAHAAPFPNFKANKLSTCPEQKIHFSDNSINSPTTWEWKFEPNHVNYLNGTSAFHPNPVVAFHEAGKYDVTLITTNQFGISQKTKTQYLHISAGENIPFGDKFQTINLDTEKWNLRNEDNLTTWQNVSTIGRDGNPTQAIYMNNHIYNAIDEKDEMESVVIDLTEAEQPFLRFDWAYARFNSSFADELQVIISSDCGEYYEQTIFQKRGEELATAPDQITAWFPQKSYEWKTAKLDLSDFVGKSISVKFVNVNGFGNNLFLDNFLVYEKADFPQAELFFYPRGNTFCLGEEAITFLTNVSGEFEFFWNFGENATPAFSPLYGPHVVTFDQTGTYPISLKIENNLGYDMAETTIEVIDNPVADFDYSLENDFATFTNHSEFGETFFWNFGDGTTSTLENPTHQYAANNAYTAKLTVTNQCGESTTDQILIIVTSIEDLENNFFIHAFPNPADEYIIFQMPAVEKSSLIFEVVDVRGIVVSSFNLETENELISQRLDVQHLAQGMYFARVKVGGKTFVQRFVKVL